MSRLDELNTIDDDASELNNNTQEESEEFILAEGTVSSELLNVLIQYADKVGLRHSFWRGKGGTELYTLGDQTAKLRVHVSADNKATLILSRDDLKMDWWRTITDKTLSSYDVCIE